MWLCHYGVITLHSLLSLYERFIAFNIPLWDNVSPVISTLGLNNIIFISLYNKNSILNRYVFCTARSPICYMLPLPDDVSFLCRHLYQTIAGLRICQVWMCYQFNYQTVHNPWWENTGKKRWRRMHDIHCNPEGNFYSDKWALLITQGPLVLACHTSYFCLISVVISAWRKRGCLELLVRADVIVLRMTSVHLDSLLIKKGNK